MQMPHGLNAARFISGPGTTLLFIMLSTGPSDTFPHSRIAAAPD